MASITIGAYTYDSYVTLASANEYHGASMHSAAWDAATDENKNKALVSGTRWLYSYLRWVIGSAITVPDPSVDPADQDIQDATCELAIELLEDNDASENLSTGSNLKKVRAGSVSVEYINAVSGTKFPTRAQGYVSQWLQDNLPASTSTGAKSYGTSTSSTFADPTDHDMALPFR
jgi:hypothetical protein